MAAAGISLEEKLAADPQREAELGGLAGALGIGIALGGGAGVDAASAPKPMGMSTGMVGAGMPTAHAVAAMDDVDALEELVAPVRDDPAALAALLNQRDAAGYTVWHRAAKSGALLAVRWLAKQPAVDTAAVTENEMQAHAIHLCVIGSSEKNGADYFPVMHFLLTQGLATADLRDGQQCTPLTVAAQHGNCLCAHLLLRHGADLNAVDEVGDTALHWAAYKGHDDVCHILMEAPGAGPSLLERADSFGQTVMHLAALRGNVRAATVLMSAGAPTTVRDGQGKRPLDLVREKVATAQEKLSKGKKEEVNGPLFERQKRMVHFLAPTWRSKIEQASDKPYYIVLLCTAIAMIGYAQIMINTPHEMTTHLVFLFTQFMMHLTWQITRRTDPGSFGLRDESVSPPAVAASTTVLC
jgi:hypothetical protein